MERVTCSYCGIPFRTWRKPDGGPSFCCSGCSMASRLEIEDEKFPVTPQLLFCLGVGFAMFNQVLLLLLSLALNREDRWEASAQFALVSALLGIVVFVSSLVWHARLRLLRRADGIMFAIVGVVVAISIHRIDSADQIGAATMGLGSSAVLGAWLARGFIRKWFAGKFPSERK